MSVVLGNPRVDRKRPLVARKFLAHHGAYAALTSVWSRDQRVKCNDVLVLRKGAAVKHIQLKFSKAMNDYHAKLSSLILKKS